MHLIYVMVKILVKNFKINVSIPLNLKFYINLDSVDFYIK